MAGKVHQELKRREGNAAKVLAHFRANPGIWIDARDLLHIGGACAWRTRISDARKVVKAEGGCIENRQTRVSFDGGHESVRMYPAVISQYRYLEHAPLGRDATQPIPDRWPVDGAPYGRQKPQEGRLF